MYTTRLWLSGKLLFVARTCNLEAMNTEFEAKSLEISIDEIRAKLKKLGATLVFPEKIFERWNFDFADRRLKQKSGWLRLREGEPEGNWTLCYKQFEGDHVAGVKEIEFEVGSKDKTLELLFVLGLEVKSHQQRKREQWKFGGLEIDIDTWPWLPPFLEVEGTNEAEVQDVFSKLGLDYSKAAFGSAQQVYEKYGYYGISEVKSLMLDSEPSIPKKDMRD